MSKKTKLKETGKITYIRPAFMSYDRIKRTEKARKIKENGGKKAC